MIQFIVCQSLWLGRCVRQGTSAWKKDNRCCQLLFSGMCRRSSLQHDVKGTDRQRVGIRMCVLCKKAALSIDVAPLVLCIIKDIERSSSCFPPIGLFPASDALERHHVKMSSHQFSVSTKGRQVSSEPVFATTRAVNFGMRSVKDTEWL